MTEEFDRDLTELYLKQGGEDGDCFPIIDLHRTRTLCSEHSKRLTDNLTGLPYADSFFEKKKKES